MVDTATRNPGCLLLKFITWLMRFILNGTMYTLKETHSQICSTGWITSVFIYKNVINVVSGRARGSRRTSVINLPCPCVATQDGITPRWITTTPDLKPNADIGEIYFFRLQVKDVQYVLYIYGCTRTYIHLMKTRCVLRTNWRTQWISWH